MSGLGLFRLHQPGLRNSSSSDDEPRHTPSPPGPNPHRVKRALFGPTDHEENLRFVRKELKKAKNEAANKWNFDFDNGTPLEGRYSWEEAAPGDVPLPYLQPLAGVTETDGSESKENRVSSSSSSSSPPPSDGPTPPPSSIELPTSSSLAQRPPDPLSVPPEGSLQDLRAPAPLPTASSSSSTPLEASGATPSSSEPLGPRMKDVAKEKKITDAQYQFKSRKSRSKSSSKLRLKRLGGGVDGSASRSPSVKGRGPMPRDSEDAPLVPKTPLVPQSVPLAPQAPMVPLARGHHREVRTREGGGTSSDE